MILQDLEKFNLPDSPGVYFFMGGEEILYIGKATSLKNRVKSYFDNDILRTRGLHIANMVTLANNIKFIETRSVLEALLLETELIKKHKPKYNTISKDDKSYFVLVITDEDFPRVVLARIKDIDQKENVLLKSKILSYSAPEKINPKQTGLIDTNVVSAGDVDKVEKVGLKIKRMFGPYPSGQYAKESLKLIRRIFPFRDKCEVYDKKKPWQKKPCFSYQIGLCPGVCAGVCDKKKYARIVERLITFLEGDGEKVRRDLEEDMNRFSRELKFEEAQKVKETLFALEHIRDAHLISRDINEDDRGVRIEGFDIAHLSGKERVGVMTVVLGGVVAKHEYKKFKISTDKNDDLEGLKELFERRVKHLDWGLPDIVVVDGDERHVKVAEEILEKVRSSFPLYPKEIDDEHSEVAGGFKIVAVTKDKSHKAKQIVAGKNVTKEEVEKYKKEIVLVNAEAHRFALSYHKNLRKKVFLK